MVKSIVWPAKQGRLKMDYTTCPDSHQMLSERSICHRVKTKSTSNQFRLESCFVGFIQITLLRVIPTMTFIHFLIGQSWGILSDISSGILFGILSGISSGKCSGISSGILSGKSSGILSGISSGILSDISSGILSGILSGISSGISIWHIFWHIFWHMFWHMFWHSIWQIFWHSIWHIFWHSIWHIFWHSIWHSIWHIFLHEVRQGTLGVDTRGWGPAGNAGRGYSRLRSGREHWARMVVVEVRQGALGGRQSLAHLKNHSLAHLANPLTCAPTKSLTYAPGSPVYT